MSLHQLTTDYQNILEAFRQRPWDDELIDQLEQATAALEVAYLETIPTHPATQDRQKIAPSLQTPDGPDGHHPTTPTPTRHQPPAQTPTHPQREGPRS